MLNKLDKLIFKTIEYITLKWVKSKKYTQHKYDFFIILESWETALWLLASLHNYYLSYKVHSILGYVICSIFLSIVVIGQFLMFKLLLDQKKWYDEVFEQRKNPVIYHVMKEVCNDLFYKSRKQRILTLLLQIIFMTFLAYLKSPISIIYIFLIARSYTNYIFDFEPPDKEKDKAKDELTEIQKLSFKNLIKDLQPKT